MLIQILQTKKNKKSVFICLIPGINVPVFAHRCLGPLKNDYFMLFYGKEN
jgi:hypothetical protein